MSGHKFTNRLIAETSPYLLQHAHNPVDWYPWGPEAMEKARIEDKPIFLSIGYSACHWCHVMAHESFENEETARLMNDLFINVKVDREERPDVDTIYMQSVIALTGHGGWPMSVFLTPDQKPFLGGTYFPPAPESNQPGFPQLLEQAHDLYRNGGEDLTNRTTRILEQLNAAESGAASGEWSPTALIDEAVCIMAERFDAEEGGFGSGMKFPEPMNYTLLLRHWARTGADESIRILDKSLTKMAEGGLYDQLGGGFHRYSTDRFWRVPHFEKMLCDNALLAKLYIDMIQATKQELYSAVSRGIFDYVLNEMTSPEGAFYAAQDADTEGEDGCYYLWEMKEFLDLLGPRQAKVMARHYGVTSAGNLGRKNVLYVKESMESIAESENIAIFEVGHILKNGKGTLLEARQKRTKPQTDTKIITGWNGLMITAFASGYAVLHVENYLDVATRAAEFLWTNMWDGSKLLRIYKNSESKIDGCLEDYAYFLEGLIALYEVTFDSVWIERANQLADKIIDQFSEEEEGGFYMTGRSAEKLVVRLKSAADEAIPSANAVAALSLLRLGHLTGKQEYLKSGERTVRAFQQRMKKTPAAFSGLLSAADFMSEPPMEVVFSGPKEHLVFEDMNNVLSQDYRPNKVVLFSEDGKKAGRLPLAEGKSVTDGEPAVYLCQKQTCHPPVKTGKALMNLLETPPEIRLNIFDYDKKISDSKKEEQGRFLGVMDQIFKYSGLKK
ncbi:MAG: thioredoxin domain-containing protein [Nitrospinaceae bacterium]|nr:thioredoxin domain-containing protein [Nitrospinaceae bacterium]